MDTRGAKQHEIEKVVSGCMKVNGHRERYAKHHFEDSTYKPDHSRLCIVDKTIVSYLRISERQIRVGSSIMKMGGIGHVWTLEDHRHKGYSTAVLKDANNYMVQEKYDLSLLYTAIQPFYARLGWIPFKHTSFEMDVGPYKRYNHNGWTLRLYKQDDLDDIIKIYSLHNATRTGSIVRTPSQWSDGYGLATGLQPTMVVENKGIIRGYANLGLGENSDHSNVKDSFLSSYYPTIREVAYDPDDKEALKIIAYGILENCHNVGLDKLTGHLPKNDPLPLLLTHISGSPIEFHSPEKAMFLIISLSSIFDKLTKEFEIRLQKAQISSSRKTVTFKVDGQSCTLVLDNGRVTATNDIVGETDIEISGYLFIKLLFGDSTLSEMCEYLQIKGHDLDDQTISMIDVLFPKSSYNHGICDYY